MLFTRTIPLLKVSNLKHDVTNLNQDEIIIKHIGYKIWQHKQVILLVFNMHMAKYHDSR